LGLGLIAAVLADRVANTTPSVVTLKPFGEGLFKKRPTGLAEDVIVLPCISEPLQGVV
jgi:hypothetical protein